MWHFKNNDNISCISKTALVSCASCSHMFVNMLKNKMSARLKNDYFSFISAMKEPWVWNLWLRTKIVETVATQPRLASRNVLTGASVTRHWWNRACCRAAGKNHAKIPTGTFSFLTVLCIYSIWHFEGLPTLTFMSFSDYYRKTSKPVDIWIY